MSWEPAKAPISRSNPTIASSSSAPAAQASTAEALHAESWKDFLTVSTENVHDGTVLAAEGAFLGALIGDAAGAALEFKEKVPDQLLQAAIGMRGGGPFKTAPGQVTDDGELALALGWGLLEGQGRFDSEAIATYYYHWVESKPFDIGATTRKAIGVKQERVAIERLSHALCAAGIMDSTICYCIAIGHLIRHPHDRAGAWEAVMAWASRSADQTVKEWLDLVCSATDVPFAPQIGWARIAFVHAFRHLRNGTNYLDAITAVLKGGGDTDTNACIVGGLIGAAVGVSGIPIGMRTVVLHCNISAGSQPARPEWLQTAWAYPRILPALLHIAPTLLPKEPYAPRQIVPLPNKIVPLQQSNLRPPLAPHPSIIDLKTAGQHIGSQRSSGSGITKVAATQQDPVDVTHMNLYTPPAVRTIVIGQKVTGPNLHHINFNAQHGTMELYSMVTHELEIKNLGPQPLTYSIEMPISQWRQIEIQPSSDTIQPGQSQTVQMSLLALHPHHVAFLGRINITGGKVVHEPVYLSVHLRAVDCVAPECEVNWDRISGGEPVARGAAGQVCKMQLDGKMVAVKQFTGLEQLAQNESAEVVSEFYREIKVLSQLKHPNIVKFIAASSKFPFLAVVMEFAPYGSLAGVLAKQDIVIDWKLRLKFATDIAKGLHYLHLNRVFHRDLKSPNILIMSLNPSDTIVSAVVTDFNASKFGERTKAHDTTNKDGKTSVRLVGTTAWCSPEVLKGGVPDDKNDVFSFGVILWEIAARALPYANIRFEYQVSDAVCAGQRMDMPAYCFPPWAQLMQTCWAQNPADRPPISVCVQDLARMSRRLAEKGPSEIDYSKLSNVKRYNVLWVDDKGRERTLLINMWEKTRSDIQFLPFEGTAALKAWMKKNEDEIMFRGGDQSLRVITNRYREKDGGEMAAENLIIWLRNNADCPFPKTLALVYCSNTGPLVHLQTRLTFLTNTATFTQKFALWENISDAAPIAAPTAPPAAPAAP